MNKPLRFGQASGDVPPAPVFKRSRVARFDAKFDSSCDRCGEEIREEDPMGYDKDLAQYICNDCVEELS